MDCWKQCQIASAICSGHIEVWLHLWHCTLLSWSVYLHKLAIFHLLHCQKQTVENKWDHDWKFLTAAVAWLHFFLFSRQIYRGIYFSPDLTLDFAVVDFFCLWLQNCRALAKAYEMIPFLHFPVYSFGIPLFFAYAIYRTGKVQ